MEENNKVILHGMWASPYVKRVELALKIKGIPFEYVEEDLQNKSQLLLQYNPIYKKVPVLIHNGKAIAESHVIIEYIDETWKNEPKILPEDPYQRAKVRFWAGYFQQVLESSRTLFTLDGDKKQEALEEFYGKFKLFEEGIKELLPTGIPENHGQNGHLGLLDILVGVSLGDYKIHEQVWGIKFMNSEKNPLLFSWVNHLIELPVMKQIAIPQDKLASYLQLIKKRLQSS